MNRTSVSRLCSQWLLVLALPAVAAGQADAAAQVPAPTAAPLSAEATPRGTDSAEYLISAGDVLRISVFQSPELSMETRVDESGAISYPLIGKVMVGGTSVGDVEKRITKMLIDGGFMVAPHVTITVSQIRGSQVTVLGQVGKPGRFPLDTTDFRVTDMIALAGGISAAGSDVVVLSGTRDGKPFRREIDLQHLANEGDPKGNLRLQAGDMLFVNRAPSFYIYGEVQKAGTFRLEHGMTVMQALATGGGLTPKGTLRGMTIHRHQPDGTIKVLEPQLDDLIFSDDVIYVRESLF